MAGSTLLGVSVVGGLKAARNLMGATHNLLQGLENNVPARSARHLHEGGKKAQYDYLNRVRFLGGGATRAVAATAAIAPDFWLGLVFGDDYSDYGYLLRWWAVIYLLIFLGLPLRSGLRAIEHTRTIFCAYFSMTVFTPLAAYSIVEYPSLSGAVFDVRVTHTIGIADITNSLKCKLAED